MKSIASIIANQRDWRDPERGRTMSPRAIDESYEDSLRATQQYGVTFFLCARDWYEVSDDGARGDRHTEWYLRRHSRSNDIPTRINLLGDPPATDLLNAFSITAEGARKMLDERAAMKVAESDPEVEDDAPAPAAPGRVPFSKGEVLMLGRGSYRLAGTGGYTWVIGVPRQVEALEDEQARFVFIRDDVGHTALVPVNSLARTRVSEPSAFAPPAPAVDRSTTIQSQADIIQSQADAIKATAQAIDAIIGNYYGEGIPAHELPTINAKLEGIIGNAMQIAGEAGLVISADEYQQGRLRDLESRAVRSEDLAR